jgi:hypothetical protein
MIENDRHVKLALETKLLQGFLLFTAWVPFILFGTREGGKTGKISQNLREIPRKPSWRFRMFRYRWRHHVA